VKKINTKYKNTKIHANRNNTQKIEIYNKNTTICNLYEATAILQDQEGNVEKHDGKAPMCAAASPCTAVSQRSKSVNSILTKRN